MEGGAVLHTSMTMIGCYESLNEAAGADVPTEAQLWRSVPSNA